jgi:hypothetical protein
MTRVFSGSIACAAGRLGGQNDENEIIPLTSFLGNSEPLSKAHDTRSSPHKTRSPLKQAGSQSSFSPPVRTRDTHVHVMLTFRYAGYITLHDHLQLRSQGQARSDHLVHGCPLDHSLALQHVHRWRVGIAFLGLNTDIGLGGVGEGDGLRAGADQPSSLRVSRVLNSSLSHTSSTILCSVVVSFLPRKRTSAASLTGIEGYEDSIVEAIWFLP